MKAFKSIATLSALVCCAALAAPLSAFAAPRHKVCHIDHQHHHPVRVCHWVR
ncbi:hypothetical protein [Paraburkholderia caballeronis]|uniref:Lipoprotein n=1 Tax=Paraburkholderia caballeronis TaxID=416943 RepID=A0A1H7S999_9BURK|nr:hypothetical protein [Paraburkholderia caballeronis]PXW22969.1 hypothetical protein C7403_112170 [Paraburkholderia caballeronis]PXW97354.1 hypothetical protein C7407_112170 [Paraburkholderia caballeronis]RAJ93874.1 hypothetical protein C7409_112170 [Paraburkholderia caballeronis]TDV13859.1 hypothetical protein C7408_10929 [Paraburkholderia caballeronis]TDV15373.1 hypothetical protein C7406_11029 [Paraburkholderia caballeronis]